MIEVLKAKIHRATVTDANLNYEGSITICQDLMERAGILEYEKVSVVNVNNGNRFETYVIKGRKKENAICINGAAARLAAVGDKVIIMAYQYIDKKNYGKYPPKILLLDDDNHIKDL